MPFSVVPYYRPCLLVWCLTISHSFWCGDSLSAMPVGVVPHYRPCLLVWFLFIGYAFWCGASLLAILLVCCLTISHACWCVAWLLAAMPSGEVPHYQPCLLCGAHFRPCLHYQPCILVWSLTIGHAFSCGASLSALPVGVVPHYRSCMLAWYLTIGHACWSIATATDIFLAEFRWKKEGVWCYLYSGATI